MPDKPASLSVDSWRGETAAELRLFQYLRQEMPEATKEELAALLQLKFKEAAKGKSAAQPPQKPLKSTEPPPLPLKARAYPPKEKISCYLYPSHIAFKQKKEQSQQVPDWYQLAAVFRDRVNSPMEAMSAPPPLVHWRDFWPHLYHTICQVKQSRRLDMQQILAKSIKQQPLVKLPWLDKRSWPEQIHVIIDFSPHLIPWYKDWQHLIQNLHQWFGSRLRVFICEDGERQQYYGATDLQQIKNLNASATLLYLGDLGLLNSASGSVSAWVQLGKKLYHQKVRAYAMVPARADGWCGVLNNYYQLRAIVPQTSLESVGQSQQQAEQLLAFLADAFELNPVMVRAARKHLGFNLSSEILLRRNIALAGNRITQYQWRSQQHRQQYRQASEIDRQSSSQLILSFEELLPLEYQAEQRQQMGKKLNKVQQDFIHSLVKSLNKKTLLTDEANNTCAWIAAMIKRAGDEKWLPELESLYAIYRRDRKAKADEKVPQGIDSSQLPQWINQKQAEQQKLCLYQQGQNLLIDKAGAQVGIPVVHFRLHGDADIEFHGQHQSYKRKLVLQKCWPITEGLKAIELKTSKADITISHQRFLPWAQAMARDGYGLYAQVQIKAVAFKLRWIPPGEFLMGSPKKEPGRYGDEGPQHQVNIAQGFWLAEATCTQQLWQAVMADNPSRFKQDPQNPVERISWDKAQQFISALRQLKPELAFRLPSEAEWEYACRAGSTTAFSWGNSLSTEQANYNGRSPYDNGVKEEFRHKTLPVKSFKPNAWGLYQMHGNVWEYCQDKWHDNYQGAPADGSAWETGSSEGRVVRGGSWIDGGFILRSACRSRYWRGIGSSGLRLALGPMSSSKTSQRSRAERGTSVPIEREKKQSKADD